MIDATKLYQLIKDDPNLARYQQLETIINNDPILIEQMKKIKSHQKEMVKANYIGKDKFYQAAKVAYQDMIKEVEEMPLMSEYLELQSYFNEIIVAISQILQDAINSK